MLVQFRLRDIFVGTTLVCIGLAIEQAAGPFVLSLLLGLITISFGLWIFEFDSILLGAITGFAASFLLFIIAAWLNSAH